MAAVQKCLFIFVSIGYLSFPILCAPPTEGVEFSIIEVKEAYEEKQLSVKSPEISRNITIVGNDFIRDGKVQRIMSGSLHYFRVPAEYWRDRLQKVKAAGLNTVSTYVEWSFHEPEEGQTLFEGDQDLVKFIKIAEEEGLLVLLRPGPYICAERDLGGFPYWLLSKYPNIRLRTQDEDFIKETKIWMSKLFGQVESLLYGKGGPIILVQVENEYGSYGDADKVYMGKIRDIIKEHVGGNALLYTTDGNTKSYIKDGYISGTLTTVDFGTTDDVKRNFKDLREFMPVGPLMNSEYYPGWLTHWSETLQRVSKEDVVTTLKDLLKNNMHFNFYMFFGGTNFEFTAGANYGTYYQPDITSYDYDAPMTEAGDPTPKYIMIRNVLIDYNPEAAQIPEPVPSKKGAYGKLQMGSKVRLLSTEGRQSLGVTYKDVSGSKLPTFEALRQRGGLVLYETTLQNETDGILQIKEPRDWIFVFIDNVLQGVINRMQKLFTLSIKAKAGSRLSLLVENQGRINYGKRIHDFKGILSPVTINNKSLDEKWSITGFPLNIKSNFTYFESEQITSKREPVLYEGLLTLPDGEEPLETFVDPTGWGKGYIFVNGHNLGRYWPSVGPQVTLYLPGVWLKKAPAQNVIQIVELQEAPEELSIEFIDHPILNRTGNINQYFGKHLISFNTRLYY